MKESLTGNNVKIDQIVLSKMKIGVNTIIKPFTHIEPQISENCNIGPYANLRRGSKIDSDNIGNFVEIKDSNRAKL